MKRRSREAPLHREGDSAKMTHAIKELESLGYTVYRPQPIQLKVNDASFYPDVGTILVDGSKKLAKKGFHALLNVLDGDTEERIAPMPKAKKVPQRR